MKFKNSNFELEFRGTEFELELLIFLRKACYIIVLKILKKQSCLPHSYFQLLIAFSKQSFGAVNLHSSIICFKLMKIGKFLIKTNIE